MYLSISLMLHSSWELPLQGGWGGHSIKSLQASQSKHISLVCYIPLTPSWVLSKYIPSLSPFRMPAVLLSLSFCLIHILCRYQPIPINPLHITNPPKIFLSTNFVTPHPIYFPFFDIPYLLYTLTLLHLICLH